MKTSTSFNSLKAIVRLASVLCVFFLGVGNAWGATYTGTFTKITSTEDFTTGYYVICGAAEARANNTNRGNFAMGSTITSSSSNRQVEAVSVSIVGGTTITNPDNTIVYYITVSGTTCTFKNVNTNKYLYQTATGNNRRMGFKDASSDITLLGYQTSGTTTGFKFTFDLGAKANDTLEYSCSYNNPNYTQFFANYKGAFGTNQTPLRLFKLAASCGSDPTVTAASSNGAVISTSIPVQCASGISNIGGAGCSLTSYGFVWAPSSTTTTPTLSNSSHEVGTSIATGTAFNYTITSLTPNTEYTIRPYATNGHGTAYGAAYTVTTLQRYTISYNNNGGSGSMDGSTKDHGVAFALPANAGSMTKTGHHISGWLLNSGSGTHYDLGGSYEGNANATFFAEWTANTYQVAFNANGGTGSMSNETGFSYGVSKALTACSFTAPEHKYFIGWNTDKDAATALYADGANVSNLTTTDNGTVTLYAIWKDHTYTNYRTLCCTELGTPTNLNATPNGTGGTVYWDAVANASGYEVSIDGGANWNSTNTNSYTITGQTCGGNTVNWMVRATGTGVYCETGPSASSSFVTSACACSYYQFHYQHNSDWNMENICFTPVSSGNINYLTDELALPVAEWYNVTGTGAGGHGASDAYTYGFTGTTDNVPMHFFHKTDKSFGANPQVGNLGGGLGRFHVYGNSDAKNKYVSFIPTGYTLNFGTGDSWTNDSTLVFSGKTNDWDETEWYTPMTTLSNAAIGRKVFVGLKTANGYVWCDPYSQKDNLTGLRTKTGADSWLDGGMSTSYPNKTGKFRIYANSGDKNWYVTFVPYFQLKYNANGGSGEMSPLPATPVSCEETDGNRTVTVATSSFTAPTGKVFDHWNTAADGSESNVSVGSYTLTSDVTLYAIWRDADYNVTYSAPSNGNYTIQVADGAASSATKTAHYEQTITIVATPNSGYQFVNWTIRNTSTSADVTSTLLTGDKATTASTTFTMPDYGVTITATFAQVYTINYTATNGTIKRDEVTISSDVVEAGGTVNLPTVTGCSLPCARFLGWYAGDYSSSSRPAILAAGSTYEPTNDVTLKAIYAIVGDNYELVTSPSSLEVGSQVVFAYRGWDDDYDAYYPVAMSEKQLTNNRDVYDFTSSKVSLNADGTTISWTEDAPDVAEFTVEAGSSNGTYAFYAETVYDNNGDATDPGYIYCASGSSNGYLRTKSDKDALGSWTITISSGEATMVSGSAQTRKYLWYNPTNDVFCCYASNYDNNGGKKTSIFQRSVSNYTTSPACTTYSVSLCTPAPSNGTISASPTTVSPNGYTVVTFAPSSGYMLDAVTVTSGTADEPAAPVYSSGPTSGGTVRINNISSDITVCATFKAIPLYTVTFVDVDNGNATQTRTQASYGGSVTSPSTSSSSAHAPCDATWSFVGWAPSNTLSGETTEPTGFIAAGETIDGASITGATTYYSVYTNSSDGTTDFTPGKSGNYYLYALDGVTKHYATTWANATKLYDGYDNFATYPKSVLTLTYNSVTGKYKIYNTTIKQSDGSDKSGYFYQSINSSKDITVNEESNYTEFTITTGVADGSYRITYSYWANSVLKTGNFGYGSGFQGYAAGYDVYFEPATSLYYYNASSCTELVTMTFHPIAGGDPTWADGHPKAEYTDVAKGTISTFPTDSYDGWTFLGWTAGTSYNDNREGAGETLNEDNASATAPSQTIYSTGGNSYNLNADIDMYPVFTKFADNEPFDDINGGDYYIYYIADADIASSTDVYGATNRMYAATYGSFKYSATTSCANAALFTFTKLPNGKWTIYDNNNNGGTAVNPKQYLCGTASSNNLSLQATATATNYGEWNITVHNGNQFEAVSVDGQTFSASTTNALTGDFKNYDSDNLANGNKAQYHRIYLGSCTERVYSSDPSNQPRVEIHGTAKVTSTAGKNIKAASVLTVSATNIATANLTVTSDNSAFKFSLTSNGTYAASVNVPVVSNKVGVTPIYVEYTPTATTDGIEDAIITVSDGAGTPTEVSTELGDVQGRHVPAEFVIAAKWGDKWYALPANCTENTSSTTGVLIEVDNASDPTTATYAPSYTKWGMQTVRPSRKGEYGTRMVFTEQLTTATAEDQKALFNGSTTNIQVNAMYKNYMGDATEKYEWIPTTTDLKDYMLTSATTLGGDASARTVSLSNKGVFGTLLTNKTYDGKVRLLPATFVEPAEIQVVEWKASSVVVMYTGSGTKATTQLGDDAPSSAQSLSSAKVDHGVFELTTGTLTSAKNEPLNITIQDGSDAIVGRKSFVVPAIVSGSQDAPLGLTSDEATLTDVVILDEGVLSAVADKYTFKNITVYPGGKLVIGSGKQLGMASLTLRGGSSWGAASYEYKYPQFVVNNTSSGAYSNSSGVINYDYVTTKAQYYSFVLPYASNTKSIKYPVDIYGSNVAANNTGSFEFQYYDGSARAAGGTGWAVLAEDPSTGAGLTAGQGYTFLGMPKKVDAYDGSDSEHANTRQRYGIHRIPMSVAAATVQAGETGGGEPANKPISINVTLASKNNNSGWNLIGNPYMANVSGLTNEDIQVGQLVHTSTVPWDGKWQWDNPTTGVRYIVTTDDGQNFESEQASTATLKAFKNFFVQIQNADATSLVIPANTRTDQSLAPARYKKEVEQDVQLAVDLVSDTRKDKVDLLINDIYSAAFDQNGDFTKMMNTTNFNLYGVYPDDYLSFIAVDKATAANSIAIGYQVPAGGDYTLQLSDREYVMVDAVEALYVTDHEVSPEVTTDLLDGPYNFHVNNAEMNDTRFTMSIQLAPKVITDIDIVPDEGMKDSKPLKFLYHDKLYILRNGVIYDATGKQVREINK